MTHRSTTLLAATAGLALAATALAEPPPLIPRSVLIGNPTQTAPQISPDGKSLAWLAPDEKDVLQVWVKQLPDGKPKVVTADPKRGIRQYAWTFAPETLLYLQDTAGDENFHVFAVNVDTSSVRELTPFAGVRAQGMNLDKHVPGQVLVGLNKDNPRVFDMYRIDLATGKAELDTKNPGDVVGWVTDAEFRIRGAMAPTPEGGMQVRVRADDKGEFKPVVTYGVEDADGGLVGFSADGKSIYLESSVGRDTLALVRRALGTEKDEVLAENARADVGAVVMNPDTHTPEAVAFNYERTTWTVLDPQFQADYDALTKAGFGDPAVVNRDKDLKTWVVAYTTDVKGVSFYVYDRPTKKLSFLFDARPALAKYALAPMKPVVIKTRDGLDLVSYLTLPPGSTGKNLPMVLDVHGGPWARDAWGFDPESQWLANRGYAVLKVNYRGSTGFGKKFLHAGDREWAAKMHDDLLDAVQWAVKDGVADGKRVAIYGGSYGGYAALVGATFTPDVFCCAVDIVGPSNLVTLLKSIPPYWGPMKQIFSVRVGDLDKEEDFLKSRSPLFKADQIKIPLLIAQGKNDPRVKQAESEQIVEAMKKAGKPVTYMLFEDEGHGFARPENRLKFYAAAERFLAEHLGGGRVEPEAPAK